ncbi:unnamed protein product [Schistosoma mansoni]|uniref:Smp_201310 n=1 Tax=Schistosoma mansoni TaxID=6183 RepID=UPI00022C87A7|nr:unnamed protein product [Schistosoma mansoni]|eukprot:XP_018645162.1 unnamed protein product [Schistosoma mansoni]
MSIAVQRFTFLPARRCCSGFSSIALSTYQKAWFTKCNSKHPNLIKTVSNEFILKQDFVTENQQSSLINELDSVLCKRKYQTKHWDYVSYSTICLSTVQDSALSSLGDKVLGRSRPQYHNREFHKLYK